MLVLVSLIVIASALPAPAPAPVAFSNDSKKQASETVEDLKEGEEEKDLKGSESVYHGYYGGYPLGYSYPSYYYSSVYQAAPYYSYAYRPYSSYWW